jgi:hypothetical protein
MSGIEANLGGAEERDESWVRSQQFFRGLRRRIGATLGLVLGGGVAIVLYLAFLAVHYAWYQNLAIILLILVVVPVAVIGMWVSWAMNHASQKARWSRRGRAWGDPGLRGGFGGWASDLGETSPRDPEGATRELESYVSFLEDIEPRDRARVAALSGRFHALSQRLDRLSQGPATSSGGAPVYAAGERYTPR